MEIGSHGLVERIPTGEIVVSVKGPHWSKEDDIVCLNPDASEKERIHQKTFRKKPIYLPAEYEKAMQERIWHPDNFVFSMNGYSQITEEQCLRYGIQSGSYEEACAAIMRRSILHLRRKFAGAYICLTYGASNTGVDWAIEKAAREFNIVPLGFSCPVFMLYVKDDDIPVFVAATKDEYADYFIRSLDLLIATGGREHALQHDVLAACIYGKRIHFIDVLNSLSSTGGVPATISDGKGGFRVDNAAAAFGRNISFFSRDDSLITTPPGGDRWDAIFDNVASVATSVCRQKMSPSRKFQ